LWKASEEDVFPIRKADKQEDTTFLEGGLNVQSRSSSKHVNKLIIRNDERRVLAVATKSKDENEDVMTYQVFACVPVVRKQKPAKKTKNSRTSLYHWAELQVPVAPNSDEKLTMGVWDGKDFKPTYQFDLKQQRRRASITMVTTEADDDLDEPRTPATVAKMAKSGNAWRVTALPNMMDPCLLLCFAATIEDVKEWKPYTADDDSSSDEEQLESLRSLAFAMSSMLSKSTRSGDGVADGVKEEIPSSPMPALGAMVGGPRKARSNSGRAA
jgi:hypothetical protein